VPQLADLSISPSLSISLYIYISLSIATTNAWCFDACRIAVYWENEDEWFEGVVASVDGDRYGRAGRYTGSVRVCVQCVPMP
jgi:hypothetical protein